MWHATSCFSSLYLTLCTVHKFYFKDDGVCQGVTNSCYPPSQQVPKAPPNQQIPIIYLLSYLDSICLFYDFPGIKNNNNGRKVQKTETKPEKHLFLSFFFRGLLKRQVNSSDKEKQLILLLTDFQYLPSNSSSLNSGTSVSNVASD